MKAMQCDYFVLDIEYLENDCKTIGTKIVNGLVWKQDGRLIGVRQKKHPHGGTSWILNDIMTGDAIAIRTTYNEEFVNDLIDSLEAREKAYPEMTAEFKKIIEDAYKKRPDMWAVIEEVAEG